MLDTRTALLFTAFLDLILPLYAWISLAGQRTRATTWWCVGGPLVSVGLILLVLRSTIPDFLSFNVGNLLIVAGFLVLIQALRWQVASRPPRAAWIFWVLVLYFVCYFLLRDPNQLQRIVSFGRGVLAVLTVVAALISWKFARREPSNNVYTIAIVFSLLAAVTVLQFIQTVAAKPPVYLFMPGDRLAIVVAVMSQIAVVVSNFSFVGLEMDRSVRKQVQIAADQARSDEDQRVYQRLTELTRQGSLSVISATLGHELNQPLTAILTNAQVAEIALRTGRSTPSLLLGLLQKMVFNTNRAVQIIDRMHSLNRPGNLEKNVTTLDELVSDTLQLVAQELQQNQVQVLFTTQARAIRILVDQIQLSQVLVNVLHNAVAAMSGSGIRRIYIECTQRGETAVLTLKDTGPGLSVEQLEQAGVPFYTTKPTGMGIGLSISRAILDRHDGTLTLSNAVSGGAVVELNLPVFNERRRTP